MTHENSSPLTRLDFAVDFQGELIECASDLHAAALRRADELLTDKFSTDLSPAHLDWLSCILAQYGRTQEADLMLAMASRVRSAQEFLEAERRRATAGDGQRSHAGSDCDDAGRRGD